MLEASDSPLTRSARANRWAFVAAVLELVAIATTLAAVVAVVRTRSVSFGDARVPRPALESGGAVEIRSEPLSRQEMRPFPPHHGRRAAGAPSRRLSLTVSSERGT